MNIDKVAMQKLESMLKEIYNQPKAEPFRLPVDHKRMGLTDYPMVIQKMMDLHSLIENLDNSKYETVEETLDDLQLIWDNCKLYNLENSKIHQWAFSLEKMTAKLVKENFGDLDYGKNNPSYQALEGRKRRVDETGR